MQKISAIFEKSLTCAEKDNMQARDASFEDLQIGESASFERTVTEADMAAFAALSGDLNPLHTDDAYAATTRFGKRVVYGMLLGAWCSQLVGMHMPGKRCVYVSQSLLFKKPIFIGDTIVVTGHITEKSLSTRLLTITISITVHGETAAEGIAITQVLSDT